jgi:hypothetical protein
LLQALKSYAANTPELMKQMRQPAEKPLPDYTITVHGIKSSSYGIGAGRLGAMAEELERAAHSGDFAFIREHNAAFLQAAGKLIVDLSAMLRDPGLQVRKPEMDEPDPDILDGLREACARYDMDGVDAAMAKLESFSYKLLPELIPWLRERVDRMEFQQIKDKLFRG